MQRIKKVITCFLTVIVLLSVAGSANAMKSSDYPVEIHVMTAEERNAFESQTEATPIVGTAFLSPNNEAGTNGSICAPFTAETANMAFVVKSAPGALNYNVQLYCAGPYVQCPDQGPEWEAKIKTPAHFCSHSAGRSCPRTRRAFPLPLPAVPVSRGQGP